MKPGWIHPTAIVDAGARIGAGTKIWHFVHVSAGARIGRSCTLGQGVFVGNNVRIGNGVKIQNHVSLYEGVELEDDVFCGPSCVFTNVTAPRSAFPKGGVYEKTRVGRGCTIGANATIVCGVTLGRHSFVAAGAVVTKDVMDFALVAGNPARPKGWRCECGSAVGPDGPCACGRRYRLKGARLVPR